MYSKLPNPRSIRLLDIAPGKAPDRIEVSLMVVNHLDEAPEFEALSYVWGTLDDPLEIICDNEVASVTQNLYAALQRLRQIDEPRRVWIDALCINQNDFDERAQQVSFMKDVYARAKRVVVWLGPDEDGNAALAASVIESTAEYVRRRKAEDSRRRDILKEDEVTFQRRVRTELPPRGHNHWKAMWWLFSREWFSRIWIIQEIAQDEGAMMVIGDQTMRYDSTIEVARLFVSSSSHHQVLEEAESLIPILGAHVFTQIIKNGLSPSPLLNILRFFCMYKATNPRDKLYAILGLSQEGQELNEYPLIRPNYRKSVVQVYADLVYQLISAPRSQSYGQGGLDVLGRTNILRHIECRSSPELNDQEYWPSWVPHFYKSVPVYNSLSNYDQALSWATSYDSTVKLGPMRKGSLVLKGLRLSIVERVYMESESYTPNVLARLLENVRKDLADYGGPDTITESFAQTITAGHSLGSEADLMRYLATSADATSNYKLDRFDEITNSLAHHQMFLSSNGRLGYGAVPFPGCEVWLLFGGRTLYMLHPTDDCYRFVGECYVHGYMNGEGMDMWKAGKLQSEWVELR